MNDDQIFGVSELFRVSVDDIAEDPDRDDLFSLYKTESDLFYTGQEFIIIRDPDRQDLETGKTVLCESIKEIIRDQNDDPVILEDLILLPAIGRSLPESLSDLESFIDQIKTQIAAVMGLVWYCIDGRLYTYGDGENAIKTGQGLTAVKVDQKQKKYDPETGSFYHVSANYPKVYLS